MVCSSIACMLIYEQWERACWPRCVNCACMRPQAVAAEAGAAQRRRAELEVALARAQEQQAESAAATDGLRVQLQAAEAGAQAAHGQAEGRAAELAACRQVRRHPLLGGAACWSVTPWSP